MTTYDNKKQLRIKTPKKLELFFNEIEQVCKRYNFSISHEDHHGGFEIEKYIQENMDWFKAASKNY